MKTSIAKGVKKLNPLALLLGALKWCSRWEKFGSSSELNIELSYDPQA
jgi:hypothetical protein